MDSTIAAAPLTQPITQIFDKVTFRGVLPERTANADPVENSMIAKSDRKKDLENNFIVKFNF